MDTATMTTKKNDSWVAQIQLYDQYADVTCRLPSGNLQKRVEVAGLATVFAQVPVATGLLPQNTMFFERRGAEARIGIYVPPQKYELQTARKTYNLPLPAFLFTGIRFDYRLFALQGYPANEQTPLFRPPLPNIHQDGRICAGDLVFPACTPATVMDAWEMVVRSYFTGHLLEGRCKSHKEDVLELWDELDGKDEFPADELVPQRMTLKELMRSKA